MDNLARYTSDRTDCRLKNLSLSGKVIYNSSRGIALSCVEGCIICIQPNENKEIDNFKDNEDNDWLLIYKSSYDNPSFTILYSSDKLSRVLKALNNIMESELCAVLKETVTFDKLAGVIDMLRRGDKND